MEEIREGHTGVKGIFGVGLIRAFMVLVVGLGWFLLGLSSSTPFEFLCRRGWQSFG